MKRVVLIAACMLAAANVHAGKYADAAGLYKPNSSGECKSRLLYGKKFPDQIISEICVPITTLMNEEMKSILRLGIVELTNPEQLESMERLELLRLQPAKAYEVEIDSFKSDIFKLVDGSILEKTDSSYVGYVGYHEDGILYRDGSQWRLCLNDSSHKVDVLKNVEHHYSRNSLSASVAEIEKRDECQ